jgi:eukaryotic-like serine/threonine-protein kinase
MPLSAGSHLGTYQIIEPLGKGGMGEVYRARDAKLGRDVAIKVLPEDFARDPERVARFQREAQVLASLNHANIGAIHDLEKHHNTEFLILELVEGETLAERIARGPIPADETVEIGKQIAEALAAAHEKGIVHRDLKPANVKITPAGVVKVLDFGLAKFYETDSADSSLSISDCHECTYWRQRHSWNGLIHESRASPRSPGDKADRYLGSRMCAFRNVDAAIVLFRRNSLRHDCEDP